MERRTEKDREVAASGHHIFHRISLEARLLLAQMATSELRSPHMAMHRTGGRAPFIILRRVSTSMSRADHQAFGFTHLQPRVSISCEELGRGQDTAPCNAVFSAFGRHSPVDVDGPATKIAMRKPGESVKGRGVVGRWRTNSGRSLKIRQDAAGVGLLNSVTSLP